MICSEIRELTTADVEDQAACAADNAEPLEQANPFEPGTPRYNAFNVAYRTRLDWLHSAL